MDHSQICNEAIRSSFLLPKRPAKAKFRMQDFAGNNLVGAIPYFVIETFNQPLRRHLNLPRRSCETTSSGLKFLKHADSRPKIRTLPTIPLNASIAASAIPAGGSTLR